MIGRKRGTVEVLEATLESLRDGEYRFDNWGLCTCGHVWAAAKGKRVRGGRLREMRVGLPSRRQGAYSRALVAIADATPGWPSMRSEPVARVSDLSYAAGNEFRGPEAYRHGAIRLVRAALDELREPEVIEDELVEEVICL